MIGVRYVEDRWEGRCEECTDWWPLELDFWWPRHGLRKCRACIRERHNESSRAYYGRNPVAASPETRKRWRDWYAANKDRERAKQRATHARKMQDPVYRETRAALHRASYERRKPITIPVWTDPVQVRVYKRDWMRAYRARLKEAA